MPTAIAILFKNLILKNRNQMDKCIFRYEKKALKILDT